jgi:hypothetical protein
MRRQVSTGLAVGRVFESVWSAVAPKSASAETSFSADKFRSAGAAGVEARCLVPKSGHRRSYVAVFLIVLLCSVYFLPRWADWNQNSRFDLVVAVVDDHTLQIDRYVANTGDYALYEGHYYSDKAPGIALLGLPVYSAFRHLVSPALMPRLDALTRSPGALDSTLDPNGTGIQPEKLRFYAGMAVTDLMVGALPAAGLAVLFFWMVGRLGGDRREQWVATLMYTLATPAFAYANSLVGHQTSAGLLFAAFVVLFGVRQTTISRRWLFLAGLLLGFALITEYPTGLIVVVLGLYALFVLPDRVQVGVRLALGAVPPLLALVVHDMAAFGTPLPVGYLHSALWVDVHQIGFVSLTYPHVNALVGLTFGVYRGLFFLSPYLLLAVVGFGVLWRRRQWRAEVLVLAAAPLVYLLFNSSSAMWDGGFGVGPRYLVASLPFLAIAAGAGLVSAWRTAAVRPVLIPIVVWSFFAVWTETIGGQVWPDYSPNPLFDFSLPKLVAGDVARNVGMLTGLGGWASLLPLACALVLIAVVARTSPTTHPGIVTLRRE